MPANSSVLSGQRADRNRGAHAPAESGESCMHMLGAEGVRPTARAVLPSAALPSARVAQGGAGVFYEDLGAGSLQMKPSASTLTFCSQSRPSAGSVHAYHVLLPRVGGAGRRERYAPRCPAPRVANAQGCEWAYTRRPHSREKAPGVGQREGGAYPWSPSTPSISQPSFSSDSGASAHSMPAKRSLFSSATVDRCLQKARALPAARTFAGSVMAEGVPAREAQTYAGLTPTISPADCCTNSTNAVQTMLRFTILLSTPFDEVGPLGCKERTGRAQSTHPHRAAQKNARRCADRATAAILSRRVGDLRCGARRRGSRRRRRG